MEDGGGVRAAQITRRTDHAPSLKQSRYRNGHTTCKDVAVSSCQLRPRWVAVCPQKRPPPPPAVAVEHRRCACCRLRYTRRLGGRV
eukprot:scaffold6888_cov126-Isochrysis_galbana.AAC.3